MRQNNIALLEEFIYVLDKKEKRSSTVEGYRNDLIQFIDYIGDMSITDIKVIVAYKWLDSLTGINGEGIKKSTRNRKISALKTFCKYLLRNGYTDRDLLIDLEPVVVDDVKEKEFLEDDELDRLDYILNKHAENPEYLRGQNTNNIQMNALRDKAMYKLMFHSGMRVGEICRLEMSEIDTSSEECTIINIPKHKNKNPRKSKQIKVDPKIYEHIMDYRNSLTFVPENKYVFLSQNGKQMTRNTVGKKLAYFIEKAGIDKHITNHCTRHSYATRMISNGVMSDIELAGNLGHSGTNMLEDVYFHSNNKNTRMKFSKVN